MRHRYSGYLAALVLIATTSYAEGTTFTLEREVLMDVNDSFVVRYNVIAPEDVDVSSICLKQSFRPTERDVKAFGNSATLGVHSRDGKRPKVAAMIVAQLAASREGFPAVMTLSTQLISDKPGAFSKHAVTMFRERPLKEWIEVFPAPEECFFGEAIILGRLGIDPIVLSVTAKGAQRPKYPASLVVARGNHGYARSLGAGAEPIQIEKSLFLSSFKGSRDGKDIHAIRRIDDWASANAEITVRELAFDGVTPITLKTAVGRLFCADSSPIPAHRAPLTGWSRSIAAHAAAGHLRIA